MKTSKARENQDQSPAADVGEGPAPWSAPSLERRPVGKGPKVNGVGDAGQRRHEFIDGGAALLVRPYTAAQWDDVGKAWWWHVAGSVLFFPVYPLVALTVWQAPSRQSLGRRLCWAVYLVVLAALLVGIAPLVVFARRWYWLWRTHSDPLDAGLPSTLLDASAGFYPWVAIGGAALADRLTGEHRPSAPLPDRAALAEPWGTFVDEAVQAQQRIQLASARAQGPASPRITAAAAEAAAAANAAMRVAAHANQVVASVEAMKIPAVQLRLVELNAALNPSPDIEAAKRSLGAQIATAERMLSLTTQLRDLLQKLVAQLGEAAAEAEELVLGVRSRDKQPDLTLAVDSLAAIRTALQSLENATPSGVA
ncbi:MAG: hypothetical protein GEV08_06440 [Acidimicrobiia bacterium]|nr:hypothetical protein [Acidimicrobiia bacterium]